MPDKNNVNVFGRMYGLNNRIQDNTHLIRGAIDNGRWHEVLLAFRDQHKLLREGAALLSEIEPTGYAQFVDEMSKLPALPEIKTTGNEEPAKDAKPKDEGAVASAPARVR